MDNASIVLWSGFVVSLASILIVSKKNLALALVTGAIILGLFSLTLQQVWEQIYRTILDPAVILLALAMGVIPVFGGVMKHSGQIDSLIANVRLRTRYMLPFSAALMGLLPMPGGALLSAPIVDQAGPEVAPDLKALINNWYRHVFILIYPLSSAIIVACGICKIDVYVAILYLLPVFALAVILGQVFFLRRVNGRHEVKSSFSWSGLLIPLVIILCAPALDFSLKRAFSLGSASTLIAVLTGLGLSLLLAHKKLALVKIAKAARPWNFSMIIVGMFLYLHIFQASNAGVLIARIPLPPLLLSVLVGFLLAMVTGRVQLPASIIFPIFLSATGPISPFVFALIYSSIYFGYIFSPVHPCLVVTCEYFHIPVRTMVGRLSIPTLMVLAMILVTIAVI